MNVTIARRDFLQLITRAASVAEKKSTMPTLSMLKLDASGTQLTVSATDLYQALTDHCPAEVDKPGAIAVGAADLVARIKTMPDGPVTLTTKDNTLLIKGKGVARRFQQRALDANEFPPMPSIDADAPRLTIDAPVLASLISHTIFSIATDETRAHLNSLLIEWTGDVLRAVSTDGHRLSKAERQVAGHASLDILIPLKAVRAIHDLATSLVGNENTPAAIGIVRSGPTAFFLAGTAVFSVKLVDAQFPPWKQVIPEKSQRSLRVSRSIFADALRAVSVAALERTGGVKLSLSKGQMLLQSESPETGVGDDEIPVEYSGGNMSIGFSARYIIELLNALSSDEVTIELGNELDPIVVKPVQQQTGTDFVGVVMPMRI